jgi:hypothetical protein
MNALIPNTAQIPACFADLTDVYYQTIYLRSSPTDGDLFTDGRLITSVELALLNRCYPGDIFVDGEVYSEMSDSY